MCTTVRLACTRNSCATNLMSLANLSCKNTNNVALATGIHSHDWVWRATRRLGQPVQATEPGRCTQACKCTIANCKCLRCAGAHPLQKTCWRPCRVTTARWLVTASPSCSVHVMPGGGRPPWVLRTKRTVSQALSRATYVARSGRGVHIRWLLTIGSFVAP